MQGSNQLLGSGKDNCNVMGMSRFEVHKVAQPSLAQASLDSVQALDKRGVERRSKASHGVSDPRVNRPTMSSAEVGEATTSQCDGQGSSRAAVTVAREGTLPLVLTSAQKLLSVAFFSSLDLADFVLCYVLFCLDHLFGESWGKCYCSADRGAQDTKKEPSVPSSKETSPLLLTDAQERPGALEVSSTGLQQAHLPQRSTEAPQKADAAESYSCEEAWESSLFATSSIMSRRKRTLTWGASTFSLPLSISMANHEHFQVSSQDTMRVESDETSSSSCHPSSCKLHPNMKRARSSLNSSSWRTGLRWTDCYCPECRDPERDECRTLYVQELLPLQAAGDRPGRKQDVLPDAVEQCLENQNRNSQPQNQGITCSDVLFLHGFCSSSSFWADTVIPVISQEFRHAHRLLLVDLLGFGKSPKPRDSLYTIGEHAMRIESDVLKRKVVKRFHMVAHSMGCTVALALAARNPSSVLSITLFSPPFVVPTEGPTPPSLLFFKSSAPRLIGPGMACGISIVAWYEHVGRVLCSILNKGHWIWESSAAAIMSKRIPSSFARDFMRHTHHSAWHCYYNTICEGANAYPLLLQRLESHGRRVTIVHGTEDTLCSIDASRHLAGHHPNVSLQEVPSVDHVTVIVGQEKEAARRIEETIMQHGCCVLSAASVLSL